ncbi:hypothetical protein AMQ83_12510, partial [Paenibacillus riograndensis]
MPKSTTAINAITIADKKEVSGILSGPWTRQFSGGGGGGGGGSGGGAPVAVVPPVKEPAISAIAGTTLTKGDSKTPVKVARNSKLKLTAPEGQTIYYTTDGSTPTVDSKKYTGEILITGNMTIKMITDKDDTVITIEYRVENAKYSLKSNAGEVKYMTAPANGVFRPNTAISRYETIAALAPRLDMEEVNVGHLVNGGRVGHPARAQLFAWAGISEGGPGGGGG